MCGVTIYNITRNLAGEEEKEKEEESLTGIICLPRDNNSLEELAWWLVTARIS